MQKTLQQKKLIHFLKEKSTMTTQELLEFYQQFDSELPITTLRWRIHELKQHGIIYSPKRGLYALNEKNLFQPQPTPEMEKLATLLQDKFPYVKFSIYPTAWLGNLANHRYQTSNLIVEIDADVLDAAFYFLKDTFPNTFLTPDQKMYDYYILPTDNNIIVNRLHVDSPLNKVNQNYFTPKLEKLIIDLLINEPVIFPVAESEIKTIITNALSMYNVNSSTLVRYATKRNVLQKIEKLIPPERINVP